MFSFLKFLKLAVTVVNVVLTVLLEVKKFVELHYAGVQTS